MRLRLGAEKRVRSEELLTILNVRMVPVPHPVPAAREDLEFCACGLSPLASRQRWRKCADRARQRGWGVMNIAYYHASGFGNRAAVADEAVLVTGIKGPLEQGWQHKVTAFADPDHVYSGNPPC